MMRAMRPKRGGKPGEVEPHFCRRTINAHMARIRQIFKWAAAQELIPAATWHGLQAVAGIRFGRPGAREKDPVRPVDDKVIEATLPYLTAVVADMVRLQRLTGMRPGEVCRITPAELDTSGQVWLYKPRRHKTAHHGKDRVVPIGPKAQEVLRAYLRTELNRPVFRPEQSEMERHAKMRRSRRTPLTPSQRERSAASARRKRSRPPGDCYTPASLRRAVFRAAARASVPDWSPNQVRHTRATELRRAFGIDTAGAVLGHSKLETTQVYAERSLDLAVAAAQATG
jgi:integrase